MKILVAEDTAPLRETLRDSLEEEAYIVEVVADGDEAFFRMQQTDYDAAILDIVLPGKSGLEILKEVRKSKQTPILLLTARDSLQDRVEGLDLGADDYLSKPFDLPELLARLRAITRRGRGERATIIRLADVVIDTSKRRATMCGKTVELTSREYAILETLIQLRGQSVSRNYLYEHLYSDDEATLSNVLDVYICRLRAKFGKDFIKTQRGFGYIVEDEEIPA